MPIFEFECLDCHTEFEKLVRRAGATSEVACPVCDSRNLEEKISAFSAAVRGGAPSRSSSCAPSGG